MSELTSPLLFEPHHDGSTLYVPRSPKVIGDQATVQLRVPREAGVSEVSVRVVEDGEPQFIPARVKAEDASQVWWTADLTATNPVLNYRFLLDGGPTGVRWLNAAGLWHRDVPDRSDFKLTVHPTPPDWIEDAVIYQVFPDRFATTGKFAGAPPSWAKPAAWEDPVDGRKGHAGTQFYGGDLDGITERLNHLEDLGATVLYLTPFFPAQSTHRYNATTFDQVDPLLGGDAALDRLIAAAHKRGIKVMGDLTTNHTGSDHEWFQRASVDPESEERGFYIWDEDGNYARWLGSATMPKLNYENEDLRRRMVSDPDSAVRRWLTRGLDGWRIDVANMTGRHGAQDLNQEAAQETVRAAVATNPDALVVAEHVHDHGPDLQGDGWHGVMNQSGFTNPVWTWLLAPGRRAEFLGVPVVVPRLPGGLVVETIRDFTSQVPWQNLVASFNLLGSHDTSRIKTLVGGDPEVVGVGVGLLMTMPSIPMITYGDEIGMEGEFGEDGRKPMPWDKTEWDQEIYNHYQDLIAVRRHSSALRTGGLRWVHVDEDALVFLRESPGETALVHAARSAHPSITFPVSALPGVDSARVIHGPPDSVVLASANSDSANLGPANLDPASSSPRNFATASSSPRNLDHAGSGSMDLGDATLTLKSEGPHVTILTWPTRN